MATGTMKTGYKPFIPDYTTAKAVTAPYTVPRDGFIRILLTGTWTPCSAHINSITVMSVQILNTDNYPVSFSNIFPVKKGDVVAINTNSGSHNSGSLLFMNHV